MNISNIKFSVSGKFECLLSEPSGEQTALCFAERVQGDVWDIHYRRFFFERSFDNVFAFDGLSLLRAFEHDKVKVFDCALFDTKSGREALPQIDLEKSFVDEFLNTLKTDVGELKCQYYKTGNGRLSLKASLVNFPSFNVSVKSNDDNALVLQLKTTCEIPAEWIFARKTVSDNSLRCDKEVLIMKTDSAMEVSCTLSKKNLLAGMSQGGGEQWVLLVRASGILFPVLSSENAEISEFEIDDAVKGRISAQTKSCFVLHTLENGNKHQKKLKVAVMGTCFSRQAFNSKDFFNPDYKRFYECGLTAYHLSIPSIMSKPMAVNKEELVGDYQSDLNAHGESHFVKDFVKRLREYKPDYLIIENYVHISAALIETENGSYFDENYYLVGTPAFKNLKVKSRIAAECEEHFEIYKRSLLRFKEAIADIISEDRIVLVRTHPALKKIENGVISEWDSAQAIKYRRYIWERYDSYFATQFPSARIIDMRDEKYISEKSPHFKFAPSHFGSIYYRDVLNHFNKIALQDLLR